MKDALLLLGFVVIWFLVNRYILPKMGIRT